MSGKAFLKLASIDLSSRLSLTYGGNVNYCVTTCGNKEHLGNFQNKSAKSPFKWVSRYILFWFKLKGKERHFLEESKKGYLLWDYTQENMVDIRDEKVSPFVKFEIILPPPPPSPAPPFAFLWDPLRNKHCRKWNFIINFRIDSRTYQK